MTKTSFHISGKDPRKTIRVAGGESVQNEKPHPTLQRSCKGVFPFRIGTTSFIYPEDYLPNVEMLAPYMDEIELLLFEGRRPEPLPEPRLIENLAALGKSTGLTYNIHLPTDVDPGHPDKKKRRESVDIIRRVMDRTARLSPTTHTLHLPWNPDSPPGNEPTARLNRFEESLSELIQSGVPPHALSIETLNYPLEWVAPLIDAFGLRVCLDLGHLLVYGRDPADYFDRYGDKTAVIHLHGVKEGRDHLPLDHLSPEAWAPIAAILKKFSGSVSLEVFSFDHLAASVRFLEKAFGVKTAGSPNQNI